MKQIIRSSLTQKKQIYRASDLLLNADLTLFVSGITKQQSTTTVAYTYFSDRGMQLEQVTREI
jgi:hypothetical protein